MLHSSHAVSVAEKSTFVGVAVLILPCALQQSSAHVTKLPMRPASVSREAILRCTYKDRRSKRQMWDKSLCCLCCAGCSVGSWEGVSIENNGDISLSVLEQFRQVGEPGRKHSFSYLFAWNTAANSKHMPMPRWLKKKKKMLFPSPSHSVFPYRLKHDSFLGAEMQLWLLFLPLQKFQIQQELCSIVFPLGSTKGGAVLCP